MSTGTQKSVLDVVAYEIIGSDGSAMILANNVLLDSFAVETLRNHREVNDLIRRSDITELVEALDELASRCAWLISQDSDELIKARAALARFQP